MDRVSQPPTLSDDPSRRGYKSGTRSTFQLSMLDTLDIMTRTLRLARQSMLKTSRMQSYKSRSLQFPTIVSRKGKQEQKEAYRDGGRRKRNGFPSRAQ
jgi:hypothetical protein